MLDTGRPCSKKLSSEQFSTHHATAAAPFILTTIIVKDLGLVSAEFVRLRLPSKPCLDWDRALFLIYSIEQIRIKRNLVGFRGAVPLILEVQFSTDPRFQYNAPQPLAVKAGFFELLPPKKPTFCDPRVTVKFPNLALQEQADANRKLLVFTTQAVSCSPRLWRWLLFGWRLLLRHPLGYRRVGYTGS